MPDAEIIELRDPRVIVAVCPYCGHEYPGDGPNNLFVHCRHRHPDTALGQLTGGTTVVLEGATE